MRRGDPGFLLSRVVPFVFLASAGCLESETRCCAIGPGFEWGSATAAYQIEGGNTNSDWAAWEARCVLQADNGYRDRGETIADCHSNLDGPDGWTHYAEDLSAARALGHNAYRMGIEWAKIEPEPGVYDVAALAHYRDVLAAARERGIHVMITLQHFTLPDWIHDLDNLEAAPGWPGRAGDAVGEAPVVQAFARFAGDMAALYGDLVDLWVPLNEPPVSLLGGYVAGVFPPGETLRVEKTVRSLIHMGFAHARAYDAIHTRDLVDADGDGMPAEVGVAKDWRIFDPNDPDNDGAVASARRADQLVNRFFMDLITAGRLDLNADGDVSDPGERIAPELEGRLDWLGVNYYTRSIVYDSLARLCDDGDCEGDQGIVVPILALDNDDPSRPHSDLGWEIYPEGLARALTAAAEYGLPLRITENGMDDRDGAERAAFVVSHIKALERAMAAGVDVRGYYHWSLIDNLEWAEGFYPRFGLWTVDYNDPNRGRTATRGAYALAQIIEAQGVTGAIVREYGTLGE